MVFIIFYHIGNLQSYLLLVFADFGLTHLFNYIYSKFQSVVQKYYSKITHPIDSNHAFLVCDDDDDDDEEEEEEEDDEEDDDDDMINLIGSIQTESTKVIRPSRGRFIIYY
jgi:hypothetical protein